MMSAENKRSAEKIPDDLQQAIDQLASRRTEELGGLRLMHTLSHAMLQMETRRLANKLGKGHPRVKRLETQLKRNTQLTQDLRGEEEFASIQVPHIEDEDVLIQGRILDENKRGIAGLKVTVEKRANTPLEYIEPALTDMRGYYELHLKSDIVEKEGGSGYLTIRSSAGKFLHKETEKITIASGVRHYAEAEVARKKVPQPAPQKPAKAKRTKKPAPEKDEWQVKGLVVDQAGKPVSGVMVTAHDKDIKFDDALGAGLTNKKGEFSIRYNVREFREGKETGPDLYLRVMDTQGKLLHSTQENVRKDASSEEIYKIVLKDSDEAKEDPDKTVVSRRNKKDDQKS
jgi:protocatechuate 3,4-dioxygenase beta subunit